MDALVQSNQFFMLMKKKAFSEMFSSDLMNITPHIRVRLPVSLCQASDDATPLAQEDSEDLVLVLNMDAEGKANVPSVDSTSCFVIHRLG